MLKVKIRPHSPAYFSHSGAGSFTRRIAAPLNLYHLWSRIDRPSFSAIVVRNGQATSLGYFFKK
jgi:hypothetical protein